MWRWKFFEQQILSYVVAKLPRFFDSFTWKIFSDGIMIGHDPMATITNKIEKCIPLSKNILHRLYTSCIISSAWAKAEPVNMKVYHFCDYSVFCCKKKGLCRCDYSSQVVDFELIKRKHILGVPYLISWALRRDEECKCSKYSPTDHEEASCHVKESATWQRMVRIPWDLRTSVLNYKELNNNNNQWAWKMKLQP